MKAGEKEKVSLPKPVRRSSHRTQWAAQFAVASELCKRGYEVAFTMGNHPSVDLLVNSPNEVAFSVDVKGLYRKNFWAVRAKEIKHNLFYILAFVPDEGQNQFYVLTQERMNKEIEADLTLARTRAAAKGRSDEKIGNFTGLTWGGRKHTRVPGKSCLHERGEMLNTSKVLVPQTGLEPVTPSLRMTCSTN
jgi:hypothetical protein